MRRLPESKMAWTDGCMDESIEGGSKQLYDFCTSMQPVLKAWDSDSSLPGVAPTDGSEEPTRTPTTQSTVSLSNPKSHGSFAKWRQRSQSVDSKCSFQAPDPPQGPDTTTAQQQIDANKTENPSSLLPKRKFSVDGLVKRPWNSAPEQGTEPMEYDSNLPHLDNGITRVQSDGPISPHSPSATVGVVRPRRIGTPPQSVHQEIHFQRGHVVPSSSSSIYPSSPMANIVVGNKIVSPLHMARHGSVEMVGASRFGSKPRPNTVSGGLHTRMDERAVGAGHQYAGNVRAKGGNPLAGSNYLNPADWLTADVTLQRASSAPSMKFDPAEAFMLAAPTHENSQRAGGSCPSAIGEYEDLTPALGLGLNLHGRRLRRRGLSSPNHYIGDMSPSVKLRATSIGNLEHVGHHAAMSPPVRLMNPPTHNFNPQAQLTIHVPGQSTESAMKTNLALRHGQTPYQRSRSATWGHVDAHGRILDPHSSHVISKAASAEQPQLQAAADFGGYGVPVNHSGVRSNRGLGFEVKGFVRYSSDPTIIINQIDDHMRASTQRFCSLPTRGEVANINAQLSQMDFGTRVGSMGGLQTFGTAPPPNRMDVNAGKTLGDLLDGSEIHLMAGGYQTNGLEERILLNPMRLHSEPHTEQFSPKIVLSTPSIISTHMDSIHSNGSPSTEPRFGPDLTNNIALDDYNAIATSDPTSNFGNQLNQLPIVNNGMPRPMTMGTMAPQMGTMDMDMTPIAGFLLDPTNNSFQTSPADSESYQIMLSPIPDVSPADLMSDKPTDPQELFDIYNELKSIIG
eukprot:comp17983_c0_seq1/m.18381 comp17983_c0_seq1/g.18381  ORF comp17983_c0_seq1/g.18381 comp17983_c0_seq1/m.18381 type:complete len:792 (-) comp17983_c0_seq1:487-2862(-)